MSKKSKRKYAQNRLPEIRVQESQYQRDLTERQPESIRDRRKLRWQSKSKDPRGFTIWSNLGEPLLRRRTS